MTQRRRNDPLAKFPRNPCWDFPRCICGDLWQACGTIPEQMVLSFTPVEREEFLESVCEMLICIMIRAPVEFYRRLACAELLDPIFDEAYEKRVRRCLN